MLIVVVAMLVGVVATITLAYGAAVLILLAAVGIPLGAEPHSPSAIEYGVMLCAAAGSAAIGRSAAVRVARHRQKPAVRLLALALPLLSWWAFFGSPGWPPWWGSALAAALLTGVLASGVRPVFAKTREV